MEKLVDSIDVEREKLGLGLSELAFNLSSTKLVVDSQLDVLKTTLEKINQQNRYLMAIVGAIVVNGGPELIGKIVKVVVTMHTGQ